MENNINDTKHKHIWTLTEIVVSNRLLQECMIQYSNMT